MTVRERRMTLIIGGEEGGYARLVSWQGWKDATTC